MAQERNEKPAQRLKLIAGQLGGVQRMLEEDRVCVDILVQLAAVQSGLAEVGRLILARHIETSLADAFGSHDAREARKKVDEVMEVFARFSRLPLGGASGSRR